MTRTVYGSQFWIKTSERALKTFAQVAAALVGGDRLNWLTLDWWTILKLSAVGAVLSILTSIGSRNLGNTKNDPEVLP